jgi:peptidyl-prolyl cis-trans isomerase SurA
MLHSAAFAAAVAMALPAMGQIAAPRYQSPIVEAPTQQFKLPSPPAITPNGTVVEDVIVRVNDQIIDRSDVLRNQQQLVEAAQQGKVPPAEFAAAQKDMLRDMIDEQLLLSRAKELDINVDTAVVRQLDDIRKQNHLDTMEDLEKAVRSSGLNYEDFKADIKNRLLRQEVVRNEVGRTLRRPTQKEEQAFYDAHKQEFEQPEQVQLSEILVPTPENATDAQVAQAQAKAQEVAAKLKAGAKFEDLAKQYSGGTTADKGGDLGLFKRGALAKVLEDQTFGLEAGQSTAPIRTRQGFVVLKVTQHIPAGVPPMKDVEDQIQEGLYSEQMAPALRKYLTDLREKAYIDIAPGFVDTGASPKETKPVYSAYAPPVPKKKTVEQKQRLEAKNSGPAAAGAAPAGGSAAPATAGATSTAKPASAKTVALTPGKKPKKIHREKVRFGQAPRNSLPAGPEETLAAGTNQGAGATSSVLPAPGAAIAPIESTSTVATNEDPLAPQAAPKGKTRFSDRAPLEKEKKAEAKSFLVKQKAIATPAPMSAEEKAAAQTQDAPLGLSGDTATKKKKKRVKGAPKERMQDEAPAPPKPKPEMTPIPPKSVRENGEPAVAPMGSSGKTTLPPAAAPAPGAQVDTQPSTPTNPAPAPPPAAQPPQ